MAQQGTVTISGFVGADPQSFGKEGGSAACSFRIGCTPRYFNQTANEWRERPTTWLTVKAYRMLALNVLACVHKGDPVVATGSLVTEEWTRDGTSHSKMVMEATGVGHDLAFGVSAFQRVRSGVNGGGGANGTGGRTWQRPAERTVAGGGGQAVGVQPGDMQVAASGGDGQSGVGGQPGIQNNGQAGGQPNDQVNGQPVDGQVGGQPIGDNSAGGGAQVGSGGDDGQGEGSDPWDASEVFGSSEPEHAEDSAASENRQPERQPA
ncbi:single-stranded DNA-binding protein [Bifidobacterium sp. ESL0763]|uniref:single-stranded DNA-binding protein n=1 Tax=Bifidobacterium sp. ESL0763 TaxID=2983227 RepID=UPI0023F8C46D|nr:single-stranded DNA-binding protein [Bifidobacterium sp. ESL0763]MDF7663577.1 single-stranded DNA-binding protein [Bifidobacterium sp. ESL0763]